MEIRPLTHNLLKPISSVELTRPPGFWTSIGVDVFAVLGALAFGFLYRSYMQGELGIVSAFVGGGIFLITSVFPAMLTRSWSRRMLIFLLQLLFFFVLFWDKGLAVVGSAATVIFVFGLWGELTLRHELKENMAVRFIKLSQVYYSKVLTGVVLAVVILYYPMLDATKIYVPQGLVAGAFEWSSTFVHKIYPEVDLNNSFGTFIKSIAKLSLSDKPEFKSLTPSDQEHYLDQTYLGMLETVEKSIGSVIDAEQSVAEVLYKFLNSLFEGWKQKFGDLFFAVWVIAVFLVVRSFGVIFAWAVSLIAFLIYQVLIVSKMLRVVGESRIKEVLEYS